MEGEGPNRVFGLIVLDWIILSRVAPYVFRDLTVFRGIKPGVVIGRLLGDVSNEKGVET